MTEDGITIYIEGGVIQDICGIPKNQKITVVDWDSDGVDLEDLTQIECAGRTRDAIVSEWKNNPVKKISEPRLETCSECNKEFDLNNGARVSNHPSSNPVKIFTCPQCAHGYAEGE